MEKRKKRCKHPRMCFRENGKPKMSFENPDAAWRSIPLFNSELDVYECKVHGWHIGHRNPRHREDGREE